MNFELTISGLCVAVLKSKDPRPEQPSAVDILIPHGCEHIARLSYAPLDVTPFEEKRHVKAELINDPKGERIASWRLDQCTLDFRFDADQPRKDFNVHWGDAAAEAPSAPWEETWLNWLPTAQDLGIDALDLGADGKLPKAACARISLPPGTLATRQMIRRPASNELLKWRFRPTGVKKALANDLVYTVNDVKDVTITNTSGNEQVIGKVGKIETLRMCLSNDMELVPVDYARDIGKLEHLKHIEELATSGKYVEPEIAPDKERTGHPTCMNIVFVDRS